MDRTVEQQHPTSDATRAALAARWPLFGLVVRTPRVELRYPTDDDLLVLAGLTGDVHDPAEMPFCTPWTRLPDAERERGTFQFHWRARGAVTADAWELPFVTVVDGEVAGTQSVLATDWRIRRTVETGSWLHRPRHGQGLGTEMRAAVLHLAFAGLGAHRAETEAYEGNRSAQGVNARLGYRPNGDVVGVLDGAPRRYLRFVLDRHDWERARRDDVEVSGLEPCRELLGC